MASQDGYSLTGALARVCASVTTASLRQDGGGVALSVGRRGRRARGRLRVIGGFRVRRGGACSVPIGKNSVDRFRGVEAFEKSSGYAGTQSAVSASSCYDLEF